MRYKGECTLVEVKATNGDTFLGGEDFDARIMDYLADENLPVEYMEIPKKE